MPHDRRITAVERVSNGKLTWSVTTEDEKVSIEEDGAGIAPPEIRKLLLAQHGLWDVHVVSGNARASVMLVLRQVFDVSLNDAQARTAALPCVVYSGTRGESDLLLGALEAVGVAATVSRTKPPTA